VGKERKKGMRNCNIIYQQKNDDAINNTMRLTEIVGVTGRLCVGMMKNDQEKHVREQIIECDAI
jgi:hypothetical protein